MNDRNSYATIDEYISNFSPDIREVLNTLRVVIRESAPEAREKISYGMPTFELHGNLVHFAAFKNHIGFYPAPAGIESFEEETAPYHASKGTLQFPLGKELPYDLISRIVKFRVAQNLEKASRKRKKTK